MRAEKGVAEGFTPSVVLAGQMVSQVFRMLARLTSRNATFARCRKCRKDPSIAHIIAGQRVSQKVSQVSHA